jgi:hypothetical protein
VASWSFLTNPRPGAAAHRPPPGAQLREQYPVACNRDIADFMISSLLMGRSHQGWDPAPGQARHNQAALRVARAG